MNIQWSDISPEQYELLCYRLLEINKFTDLAWHGGSGDRGRDLVAFKIEEPLPGITRRSKWVVQCKRYTSRPPDKRVLRESLAAAREHDPDNVLLIISHVLSSAVKDWLASVANEYQFPIYTWERPTLEGLISRHRFGLGQE